MIYLVKKIYTNAGSIVAMVILFSFGTVKADSLTPTELHATLGIVTNFILDDDSIIHNGTSYGKVTSPYTGRVWLDRNLGASRVCTSLDDTQCYGDYYQWGRNADGHQKSNSYSVPLVADNVTNVGHGNFITSSSDWASVDLVGVERTANWTAADGSSVCPVGFRVPILAELRAELLDVGSAQTANNTDAFNTFLKLPSAGYHSNYAGALVNQGTWGGMWSSSVHGALSYNVNFGSSYVNPGSFNRARGFTLRCIKSQVHKHNGTTYGEVISPYTGKIWLDRNLGANRVCTSLADTACYGDYYQWGRNADGHENSNSYSVSTLADNVTNVGHGNFIISSSDWASVDLVGVERTANWTVTDGSSVCPVGFRVPVLAELKAELLDIGSAHIANKTDAFNTFLKLPSAGYHSKDTGALYGQGLLGSVWSSSVNGLRSRNIRFSSGSAYPSITSNRSSGFTVRCLRD